MGWIQGRNELGGREMGGLEGGKTVVATYCMKAECAFNKKRQRHRETENIMDFCLYSSRFSNDLIFLKK